jgi:hypothetical protein
MTINNIGIKDAIGKAKTEKEVKSLLKEGLAYKDATPRTKNRMQIAAAKRINELTAQDDIKY